MTLIIYLTDGSVERVTQCLVITAIRVPVPTLKDYRMIVTNRRYQNFIYKYEEVSNVEYQK